MVRRLLAKLRRSRAPLVVDPAVASASVAGNELGGRRRVFPDARPNAAPPFDRAPFDAALSLPHGAPADEPLLTAIAVEMHRRRAVSGTLDGPSSPVASGLHIRREGLPDWWDAGGNLMLCGPDCHPLEIQLGMLPIVPERSIVVIGAGSRVPRMSLTGGPAFVFAGDRVMLNGGGLAVVGPSTMLIGEGTTATWMPSITAHNGGMILVGPDNMWAPGVLFMTDDSHEILDLATGKRINRYGGRIVLDRHVWLGYQASLSGDCYVGPETVIGQGSLVKNARLPGNAVCSGRPARPLRTGVTWTRQDRPCD